MYKPKQLAERTGFRDRKFRNYQYLQMMPFSPVNTEEKIKQLLEVVRNFIKVMRCTNTKMLSVY